MSFLLLCLVHNFVVECVVSFFSVFFSVLKLLWWVHVYVRETQQTVFVNNALHCMAHSMVCSVQFCIQQDDGNSSSVHRFVWHIDVAPLYIISTWTQWYFFCSMWNCVPFHSFIRSLFLFRMCFVVFSSLVHVAERQ